MTPATHFPNIINPTKLIDQTETLTTTLRLITI